MIPLLFPFAGEILTHVYRRWWAQLAPSIFSSLVYAALLSCLAPAPGSGRPSSSRSSACVFLGQAHPGPKSQKLLEQEARSFVYTASSEKHRSAAHFEK